MLTEEHRTKLDGIVQQMISNKETEDNIQWVVNDFKQKYSEDSELLTGTTEDRQPHGVTGEWEQDYGETLQAELAESPYAERPEFKVDDLDVGVGALETGAQLATGMASGIAGLGASIITNPIIGDKASKELREYVSSFSYKPQFSKSGKGSSEILSSMGEVLSKPREWATEAGGEKWGNVADVALLSIAPKVPKAIKATPKTIQAGATTAGEYLYSKTLRPSGKTYAQQSDIISTGYKGKFWANEAGLRKFQKVKSEFDRTLNQIMYKYKGKTVPVDEVLSPEVMNPLYKYARNSEAPVTHTKAVDNMVKQRRQVWKEDYPDGNIPVGAVQEFKTTQYQRYQNAYGETKKAMSAETAKAFGRGAKESLDNMIPELQKINPFEGDLIRFYEEFDKALRKNKNEHISINNNIINNKPLLTSLAKMFRKISPDHMYANPKLLKAYLKDIPSPTKADIIVGAQDALLLEWSRPHGMADVSGVVKEGANVPPLVKPTTKALPAPTDIKMGMSDVTGKRGMSPQTPKPTMKAIGYRDKKPMDIIYQSMKDENFVKALNAEINNPDFWLKNRDLMKYRAKLEKGTKLKEGDWTQIWERTDSSRLYKKMVQDYKKQEILTESITPLSSGRVKSPNEFQNVTTGSGYTQDPRTGKWKLKRGGTQ